MPPVGQKHWGGIREKSARRFEMILKSFVTTIFFQLKTLGFILRTVRTVLMR